MSLHKPTLLLASTLALLLVSSGIAGVKAQESTCYDTWGNKDSNQVPCHGPETTPDSKTITHCCNKNDYCLSNGLSSLHTPDGLKFCCGNDQEEATTCCESSSGLTIPTGTLLLPSSPLLPPSESSSTTSETLKIGLGIGLGIGIPIFAILLVVAYFLAHPRYPPSTSSSSRSRSAHHRSEHQAKHRYHPSNLSTGWRLRAPSRSGRSHHEKRDSFGRVDTNVGPPSEDGDWAARTAGPDGAAAWPPTGTNVAAAIAAWANINAHHHAGNDDVPPSPKEMDARSRAGSRLRYYFRGETPTPGRYELPAEGTDQKGRKIGLGVGVRELGLQPQGDQELPACPNYSEEEPGAGTMGTTGTIGPDSMTINVGAMPVTPGGMGTMGGTPRGEQVSPLTAVEGPGTFSGGGVVLDKAVGGEVNGQGHERCLFSNVGEIKGRLDSIHIASITFPSVPNQKRTGVTVKDNYIVTNRRLLKHQSTKAAFGYIITCHALTCALSQE
ncbi:hypothetical protein B0T21DRAFT_440098 [Apiosordaria backusii]|uniref:Uncharacterized protein n=1 Tax=Apiosordaria backusii TaxID=314023 RepID=A0AA40BKS9_9PEZI|nr:hypothetical protein B0T21DRAFT_440098 [Apiosordaria backusii]